MPTLVPHPAGVSAVSWEMLAIAASDARHEPALDHPALRVSVRSVVRELRAAGVPWAAIYATLAAVIAAPPPSSGPAAPELEVHESRAAALVAQMQGWADVERLAEIEGSDA